MGSFISYDQFLNNLNLLESSMRGIKSWTEEDHKKFDELRFRNLVEICELCDKYKVRYHLDAGTLLGLYRDKKMISGDSDNDISIMSEDITPEFLEAISDYCKSPEADNNFFQPTTFPDFKDEEKYLKPLSLKYHSLDGNGKRLEFKGKKIWTDLFILYPCEDYHLFMLWTQYFRIPNKFLKKRGTLTHKGVKFSTPGSVEDYLEHVFGKGWVSPDPNYISSRENKGFYVILIEDHGKYKYNWAKKEGIINK